jgi:YVTN family beta-propeller protein
VYVANSGSGNVSVIQGSNDTVSATIPSTGPLATGAVPVWVTAKSDSSAVYVLDQANAQVIVIDPITDTALPVQGNSNCVGPTPNFMYFDSHLLRLYVTNSGSNTISAFDVSNGTTLTPLSQASTSGCPNQIALGTPAGSKPVSVTALVDGTRVYVVNSGSNNVTVLNSTGLTVKTQIQVGTNPVSIAASSDGSKVYVANHDPTISGGTVTQQPGTTVIGTGTDLVITTITAPFQNAACTADDAQTCPRNAPVWVVGY